MYYVYVYSVHGWYKVSLSHLCSLSFANTLFWRKESGEQKDEELYFYHSFYGLIRPSLGRSSTGLVDSKAQSRKET